MTIEEIENNLPEGFHDANLEAFVLDLQNMLLKLSFNLLIGYDESNDKTIYRRGEVLVRNVSFFNVSPYMALPMGKIAGTVFNISNELPVDSGIPIELIKQSKWVADLYVGDAPSFFDVSFGYESAEFTWTGKEVSY